MRSQSIYCRQWQRISRFVATSVLAPVILSAIASTAHSQAPAQVPGVAAGATVAANSSQSKIESYPLNAASRPVLAQWQQQFTGRTDVHMAIDDRTSQAVVFAPPAVHAQIRQQIAQSPNASGERPAANGWQLAIVPGKMRSLLSRKRGRLSFNCET